MSDDPKSLIPPTPKLTVACDIPIPGVPSAAECMFKKLMAHIAEFETIIGTEFESGHKLVIIPFASKFGAEIVARNSADEKSESRITHCKCL